MQRFICALLLLGVPGWSSADDAEAARKELKALEGKWKTVLMEVDGKALDADGIPAFSMVVGADGKSVGKTAREEFRFVMKIDPKSQPKTIDNLHETGSQKGQRQYGIYKLEGDKFTVCMTPPGGAEGDRAKEFTSKDGGNVVFVFERVKEEKKK